jgi:tRNA-splicing ligase RtcB
MKKSKIYAEILEQGALDQYNAVMALPDVVQGALMPDAHTGYVLPIGAVIATKGTIYPSFVGYDIGCGMSATKLDFDANDLKTVPHAFQYAIEQKIPLGFNKNNQEQEDRAANAQHSLGDSYSDFLREHVSYGPKCLGTLGGGNHFIEIGRDDKDGKTWVVIHSGSRSIGHAVATEYMRLAALQYCDGRKDETASALSIDTQLGVNYIIDLDWCLQFALLNRQLMSECVISILSNVLQSKIPVLQFINRNHNHAEQVGDRWIHRKGATHADAGMFGVIPGNMRDGSFITIGKGNPESMNSSSHGAGRVMSRTQAKKLITMADFDQSMRGIAAPVDVKHIDESPMAYKNIYEVMDLQKDLVDVVTHVTPLINVKG